jgi:hypothetical protein
MGGGHSYGPGMSELDVDQPAAHLPTLAGEARDRGGIPFILDDHGHRATPSLPGRSPSMPCVQGQEENVHEEAP